MDQIPYGRHAIYQDDIEAVEEVLGTGFITQGPMVGQFEQALAQVCGADHAVAVSSGTAALHIAALAAGLGPGSAGVTTPISFLASANCLIYTGAKPLFADIDPSTTCLNPAEVDRLCNEAAAAGNPVKMIVAVDFAGVVADLPALAAIARRHGAVLVEDAAHSLGAEYAFGDDRFKAGCCAHSDMAITSFHPVKHITTGEGGAVLTNNAELARKLRILREHGIERGTDPEEPWRYEMVELGYNYRLTDFQCALGLSQLGKLPDFLSKRRILADRYDRLLAPMAHELILPPRPAGQHPAWHIYVIRLRPRPGEDIQALAARRARVFRELRLAGVLVQVHYIPISSQPYYRRQYSPDEAGLVNAYAYYAACITLPLFPALEEKAQDYVAARLKDSLAV